MLRLLSSKLSLKNKARLFLSNGRRCLAQHATRSVLKNNEDCLEVEWQDGTVDKFPYLFLRENCRCTECFQIHQKVRRVNVPKLIDIDIAAESADLNSVGDQLNVKWQDGHSSVYLLDFLRSLRYQRPGKGQPPGVLRKGIEIWGSEFEEGKLPVFDFQRMLQDDNELFNWLVTLATRTGVARLQNVPRKRNQIRLLEDKLGYLMATNYGSAYDINSYSEEEASDTGYTSGELPMHSDYTFCHTSPAVAIFHCIEQTEAEGGVNQWVDAFHAAYLLYKEDPESFDILVRTPVAFRNIAHTKVGLFHTTSRRNLISLDHDGKICAVCYSDEFRDAYMPLPPEVMKSFYRAYFRFFELLDDRRTHFWYKMKPGEAMTVNNHRVLHGRSAYFDTDKNVRLLQLGYLDWDCVHSKIRVFAEEQGIASPVD